MYFSTSSVFCSGEKRAKIVPRTKTWFKTRQKNFQYKTNESQRQKIRMEKTNFRKKRFRFYRNSTSRRYLGHEVGKVLQEHAEGPTRQRKVVTRPVHRNEKLICRDRLEKKKENHWLKEMQRKRHFFSVRCNEPETECWKCCHSPPGTGRTMTEQSHYCARECAPMSLYAHPEEEHQRWPRLPPSGSSRSRGRR